MLPLLRSDWDDIQDWLDDHGSDILIFSPPQGQAGETPTPPADGSLPN